MVLGYEHVLNPPRMVCDVTYWMNRVLADGQAAGMAEYRAYCVNTAIEATLRASSVGGVQCCCAPVCPGLYHLIAPVCRLSSSGSCYLLSASGLRPRPTGINLLACGLPRCCLSATSRLASHGIHVPPKELTERALKHAREVQRPRLRRKFERELAC